MLRVLGDLEGVAGVISGQIGNEKKRLAASLLFIVDREVVGVDFRHGRPPLSFSGQRGACQGQRRMSLRILLVVRFVSGKGTGMLSAQPRTMIARPIRNLSTKPRRMRSGDDLGRNASSGSRRLRSPAPHLLHEGAVPI